MANKRIGSRTIKNNKKSRRKVVKELTQKEIYQKYLRSKEWMEKRDKFRAMYGNKCAVCGSVENLHIHHLDYDCTGKETINDVVCLCKGHHLDAHRSRLVIWMFTKAEMEHFKAIMNIICSDTATYLALTKRDIL